ncbi:MAG: hypothetical protein ABH822_01260 [Patescibacteria group bacterium]
MKNKNIIWLIIAVVVMVLLFLFWSLANNTQTQAYDDSLTAQQQIDAKQDAAIGKLAQSVSGLLRTLQSNCSPDVFGNVTDPCPGLCKSSECVGDRCSDCADVNFDDLSINLEVVIPSMNDITTNSIQGFSDFWQVVIYGADDKVQWYDLEKASLFLFDAKNKLNKLVQIGGYHKEPPPIPCGLNPLFKSVEQAQKQLQVTAVYEYVQSIYKKKKEGTWTKEKEQEAIEFLFKSFTYKDKDGKVKKASIGYMQYLSSYMEQVQKAIYSVKRRQMCWGCGVAFYGKTPMQELESLFDPWKPWPQANP